MALAETNGANGCVDEIDSLSGSCAQLVDTSFALTFAAQCRYPSAHIYIFCCHRSWMVSPMQMYSSSRILSTDTDLDAGYNVASCRTSRSFLVQPPAQSCIRAKHQLGMCELRHQCGRSTMHRILSQFSHDSLTCVPTFILRLGPYIRLLSVAPRPHLRRKGLGGVRMRAEVRCSVHCTTELCIRRWVRRTSAPAEPRRRVRRGVTDRTRPTACSLHRYVLK